MQQIPNRHNLAGGVQPGRRPFAISPIISVLITLMVVFPSKGQWGDQVTRISESLAWGPFHDVEVVQGNAYCAMGYGLMILDVSVPSQILPVSKYGVPGVSEGICIENNYLFLASGSAGLQVIDITSPQSPALLGELESEGYSYEAVKGEMAVKLKEHI